MNEGVEFLLFSSSQIYSYSISEENFGKLMSSLAIHPTPVESSDQIEEEIVKMQLIGLASNVQRLHAFVKHHPLRESCDFVQSHEHYYEVIKRVSKGNALKKVMEVLQIPATHTAAIGDQCNDISMLEMVGLPATLVNAHPLVKEIAVHHVPNNDEEGSRLFDRESLVKGNEKKLATKRFGGKEGFC